MTNMPYLLIFIFGSAVGSFLNVCIYRMPRNEKIGLTRSRCPNCKEIIRWHDNIPFLSYILLKARCRHCGKKISFRYFVVEFLTACLFCALWWRFGAVNPFLIVIYGIFVSFLIVGSFIDLDFLIIPDAITLLGILVGLVMSALYPALMKRGVWYLGLLHSFMGALAGGGSLYLIAVIATKLLKKEAMGMGDIKLLAMIGAFLGWQWTFFTIFSSSFLGTIAGLILMAGKKLDIKGKIPFGPFLAMGAIIALFWGDGIVGWYLGLF